MCIGHQESASRVAAHSLSEPDDGVGRTLASALRVGKRRIYNRHQHGTIATNSRNSHREQNTEQTQKPSADLLCGSDRVDEMLASSWHVLGL